MIPTDGQVQYINPEGLHYNPAFTNVIVVTGSMKTVYVGGQNAVNASGEIVGKGDIAAQVGQIMENLQTALRAGGAKLEHIIKWSVYALQGQPIQPAFKVFRQVWGNRSNPPAITVLFVSGLAHPDFLVEMDAIAVVPE